MTKIVNRKEQVLSLLENKDVQSALSVASTGLSIGSPITGAVLKVFSETIALSDEIKMRYILFGLASGFNQETFINDLKTYVSSSDEHAERITNTLRKAMLANSEMVCILMGRILADHIKPQREFDRLDNIVFHALESATNIDLIQFRDMVKSSQEGYIMEPDKYSDCIEWCLSTRLCLEYQPLESEDELIDFSIRIKLKDAAYRLSNYLEEIKQIFRDGF